MVFCDMKYVLATSNPGKVVEMRKILAELDIDIVTRDELGIDIDVKETGTTFLENAILKADAICAITDLPAIADDSGLIVNALGGEPGVYSSSYGGEELTAEERCKYLLSKMENMEQRDAKFVCTIVCSYPDGSKITSTGECSGKITTQLRGLKGFGYDPVFLPDDEIKTMAELTSNRKNSISHRGKALRNFYKLLKLKKRV